MDEILDKRTYYQKLQYLVKWKGYPLHEATWEPLTNLKNAIKLVDRYELGNVEGEGKNFKTRCFSLSEGECNGLKLRNEYRQSRYGFQGDETQEHAIDRDIGKQGFVNSNSGKELQGY